MADHTEPAGSTSPMPYVDGRRVVAVAPDIEGDRLPELSTIDRDLDAKCEAWVSWCRTRRLYGPTPAKGSVLGRMLGGASRAVRSPVEVMCSADMAAFHLAYTCQPDALDKAVFHLYYVQRVKPIKTAAAALGISKSHFYALLRDFRRRVDVASLAILETNEEAAALLAHRSRTNRS